MIIVKEIATNIVIYLLEDDQTVVLNSKCLSIDGVKTFSGVNNATYIIVLGVERPPHFYGGAYRHTGVWSGGELAILGDVIQSVKKEKLMQLSTLTDVSLNQGVTVGGTRIDSDDVAVANITSSLSLMSGKPMETIDFRYLDGWGTATKSTIEGFQNAIWELRKATYANSKLHEESIVALTTVQEVLEYNIDTGWPS